MGPATIPRRQLGGTPWGGAERASGDLKRTTVGEEEAALIVRESGVLPAEQTGLQWSWGFSARTPGDVGCGHWAGHFSSVPTKP